MTTSTTRAASPTTTSGTELHGHWQLPEPLLAFDPCDSVQRAVNPLIGLREHGPFSVRALSGLQTKVRIALLAPGGNLEPLRRQLNELVHPHEASERREYLPSWPGFSRVFRADLMRADPEAQIGLDANLAQRLAASARPHAELASALVDGLRRLLLVRDLFDVVVFYLPNEYKPLFEVPAEGFDLHDVVKAFAAQSGLTTQIVTDGALSYRCRASVAWRLATALYAKAGHTPWKLDTSSGALDPRTAYIGLSYALRTSASGGPQFVTCCSQVFDSDGGGMEFVAYDIGEGAELRNPHLSREQMRVVMARSLALYQDRHVGRTPTRLVVHKQTPFLNDEVLGCTDAWGASSDIDCISITRPSWRGVALDAPRRQGDRPRPSYAVQRGTALQLDHRSILLWVAGNARGATLTGSQNYLQGKKGTPRPLLLARDAGTGPLDEIAAQVLALSKMDWNNDALYDSVPCTVRYAQVLAQTIKHIPDLASRPYDYRLFM